MPHAATQPLTHCAPLMPPPLPNPDDPIEPVERGGKLYLPMKQDGLPAPSSVMNPIALVCAYELYGLSDEGISEALNITDAQLESIREHTEYRRFKSALGVVDKDETTTYFKKHRGTARQCIVDMMNSQRPQVALQASKLVLEGSGVSLTPEKKVDRDPMSSGLTIVVINGEQRDVPTIEVAPVP